MLFIKYILSTIYQLNYKRILKRTDYPDERVKGPLGYQLSLCIYIIAFVLTRFIQNHISWSISISTNKILLISFAYFLIFGAIFASILNFEWIKKIELTKRQKNKSRIILVLTIIIVILLFKL
ncbi:hypothetical protein C3L50_10220 [Flavobacterium alvei]|uniref:Uncharacterized protein n=1 Tax=Flavobacterium alvei TaxID=2080416 RepID=A0A2S5AAI4_9FLAO|nr:hypothetical protein C3L50_10220 [Flavobacterium alvei]